MALLLGIAGLALADAWLYIALGLFWRLVRLKLLATDWQPAVWELRDTPGLPLGRPLDPVTRQPLRQTWEKVRLPSPFAIVRDGKIHARYVIADPRWTPLTVFLWYVPEITCFVAAPAAMLLLIYGIT